MPVPFPRTPAFRPLAALLAASCLAVLASASAQEAGLAGEVLTTEFGGVTREYYLYLPPDLPEGAPLLVVLHGRGGTMQGMARLTGFDDLAAERGFAVVYPEGIENQWNYVEGIEGFDVESDDIGFLPALVDELVTAHGLDATRVYVAGFSNGGYMAERLACEARDTFAAFATVGAAGFADMPRVCGAGAPVSLLMMHGTADEVVPYGGMVFDTPNGRVTLLASVQQTISYWAAYAGCGTDVTSRSVPPTGRSPGTQVHVFSVRGCPDGHEVELVVVQGGGHVWPGHPGDLPPEAAARVNRDIDASEYIWEFFARQPALE